MTDKELYREWCKKQENMPVFMQPWWLDAVCAGKEWDVMLFYDTAESTDNAVAGGEEETSEGVQKSAEAVATGEDEVKPEEQVIVAAMPYLFRKRMGMKYILMPQQTQIGGMWIDENRLEDQELLQRLADEAAQRLRAKKLWYYYQQFPVASPIPDLLRTKRFTVKKRVTYRLDDLSDLDKVMKGFSKNKKRQLQKALTLSADTEMPAEDFYRFHSACLLEQGKKITYTREFFMVLYKKAERLGQCCILRINTLDGDTAAAAFLVWDKNRMYYLIPCYTPKYKDSGAGTLLVWESLKIARLKNLQFDFEGSMIRGVRDHYKQFGSVPTTYYSVRKYYNPLFAFALMFNKMRG